MHSNAEMVKYLSDGGWIVSKKVREAFLAVDRMHFVPKGAESSAYYDTPLPIGHAQTISAPSVVAFMLEKLEIKDGMKILELGTGSGYNAALLSHLTGPAGRVISFDIVPEISEFAKKNLEKWGKSGNTELFTGDASCGYEKEAPYDAIMVTAGMPYIENHPLVGQLKPEGRLVAPVGMKFYQDLVVYSKGRYEKVLPVMFVPLVGKCGFQ